VPTGDVHALPRKRIAGRTGFQIRPQDIHPKNTDPCANAHRGGVPRFVTDFFNNLSQVVPQKETQDNKH
jgi:hypothetical protein